MSRGSATGIVGLLIEVMGGTRISIRVDKYMRSGQGERKGRERGL